jgi:hypothetical protein
MQTTVHRLARHRALRRSVRCLATTASPTATNGSTTTTTNGDGVHVTSYTSTASSSAIPLSNVEAQWEKMSNEEQLSVHQQLEELQKKDWKELSLDEKKAGPFFFSRLCVANGTLIFNQLTTWRLDRMDRARRRVHLVAVLKCFSELWDAWVPLVCFGTESG